MTDPVPGNKQGFRSLALQNAENAETQRTRRFQYVNGTPKAQHPVIPANAGIRGIQPHGFRHSPE